MGPSAHTWVHCSVCMAPGTGSAARLHITSCGRVVCHSCIPSLAALHCPTCRGTCTRTIPLTSKAPQTVLDLFRDVSSQLKSVFKTLSWQEQQMWELMVHREATVRKLTKEEGEQLRQLAATNRGLEAKRVELVGLEEEQGALRAELAAIDAWGRQQAARRHQRSSSRMRLEKVSSSSLQQDHGYSSMLQLDFGSSSESSGKLLHDQGSSSKLQWDQMVSTSLQQDLADAGSFQLERVSASSLQQDRESSARLQLEGISSSSLQQDQGAPYTSQLEKVSSSSLQQDQMAFSSSRQRPIYSVNSKREGGRVGKEVEAGSGGRKEAQEGEARGEVDVFPSPVTRAAARRHRAVARAVAQGGVGNPSRGEGVQGGVGRSRSCGLVRRRREW